MNDLKSLPRYGDFARLVKGWDSDKMAAFLMWCWVRGQAPNPKVVRSFNATYKDKS